MLMRTGVEQTRSQKEKAQREESKDASPPSTPADAQNLPKPKEEIQRRPVLALALVSFAGCARDDGRPRRPDPSATQRRVLDGPRVLARGRVRTLDTGTQ